MKYSFFPGCAYHSSAGYKESVDAVCSLLDINLVEISDWNCCGATIFMGTDSIKGYTLCGRIIAIAQLSGSKEIITGCNACYTTLRKAVEIFSKDKKILNIVNKNLSEQNLEIKGNIKIRHLLEIFINDIDENIIKSKTTDRYTDTIVAGYYGCQFTRPWGDIDDVENPGMLEKFIKIFKFTPVEHSAKTLCCGASLAVSYADDSSKLISKIIRGIKAKKGELIITICPLCQFNMDSGQKRDPNSQKLPVLFFTQLAGIALGLSEKDLGLNKLLTPIKNL
jgi:heterodisulfide reductase subunit B